MMQADTPPTAAKSAHDLGFERLVFFSDAVFAIAITLLVLDLKLQTGPNGDVLWDRLIPKVLGFVISFSVTSFYWLAHHRLFKTLRAESVGLRSTNLVFLGCVVFLAFPTSVISEHPTTTWAVIFYALSVATTGLAMGTLVLVARHPALMRPGETRGGTLRLCLRALGVPLVFLASCPVAIDNPLPSTLLWMSIPLVIRVLGALGGWIGERLDRAGVAAP